jgi:ubiquinone biosynthesis protein UbiJ
VTIAEQCRQITKGLADLLEAVERLDARLHRLEARR